MTGPAISRFRRGRQREYCAKITSIVLLAILAIANAAPTQSERLAAFFDASFQSELDRKPMLQTMLGIRKDYGKWDDFSDQAAFAEIEWAELQLEILREFDLAALDDNSLISYRLFENRMQRIVSSKPWVYHNYPLNQEHGYQSELPAFLIGMHEISSVNDAEAYVDRLMSFPAVVEQLISAIEIRTRKGIIPPKFVFPQVFRDIDNLLAGEPFETNEAKSPLFADFTTKLDGLGLAAEQRNSLLMRAARELTETFGPAMLRLRRAAVEQSGFSNNDDGVWKLPDGDEYYRFQLAQHTTTDMSADDIHDFGLLEVKRIKQELTAIMKAVGFDGELSDFYQHVDSMNGAYFDDTDAGRAAYLSTSQQVVDDITEHLEAFFGVLPKAKLLIRRVEPFREESAGVAFYMVASEDGIRPAVYYTNLAKMSERPKYNIETIAYHEGIPGHHMQVSIAQELEGIPKFRRYGHYTAYGEGWGLYAERLGKEMGFFEDPYSDYGRLTQELWRAVRLVVDTGIHARKWTRQQVIDYHLQNTPNPIGEIIKETERYIVLPGQATAYKVGMQKILDLRRLARRTLGSLFDIREFHDTILVSGPVPLDIMEDNIRHWIAETLASGSAQLESPAAHYAMTQFEFIGAGIAYQ